MRQLSFLLFSIIAVVLVVVGCRSRYDVSSDFVVADLFATPGRALATLPPTSVVQQMPPTSPPSSAVGPAVAPTVNPLLPTPPLPTPVPFPDVQFQDGDDEPDTATLPPLSAGADGLIGLEDNDEQLDDEGFFEEPDPDFDALVDPGECRDAPPVLFANAYNQTPAGAERLGCALGDTEKVSGVYQLFERGAMFWRQADNSIFVIATGAIQQGADTDTWWRLLDTWTDADPEIDGEISPPSGFSQPRRGFGKAWRDNAFVREALGWATGDEVFDQVDWQQFENGFMFASPGGGIIYLMLPVEPEPPYTMGEHFGGIQQQLEP